MPDPPRTRGGRTPSAGCEAEDALRPSGAPGRGESLLCLTPSGREVAELPVPRLRLLAAGPRPGGGDEAEGAGVPGARGPLARPAPAAAPPGRARAGLPKPKAPACRVIHVHSRVPATWTPPHRSTASAQPWFDVPGTAARPGLRGAAPAGAPWGAR